FTGQGSQSVDMARTLYESEPVFTAALDRCAALLDGQLDRPLAELLFPPEGSDADEAKARLDLTGYTQPVLFAVEWSLAQLWQHWGIQPDIVLGHSVGELVAACVAGVMSLDDGLRLVTTRGQLMGQLPSGGAMLAVTLPPEQVGTYLAGADGQVVIAAHNSPTETVIAGPADEVDQVGQKLAGDKVKTTRLHVSHAFHSPLMQPILPDLHTAAEQVGYHPPQRTLVSNVSGEVAGAEIATPGYWCEHVRAPVRFAASVATAAAQGVAVFQEIGPHPVLLGAARQCLPEDTAHTWLPSLRRGRDDHQQLLTSLANLYTQGITPNWDHLTETTPPTPLTLPSYPFQHQRYWSAPTPRRSVRRGAGEHPLLGQLVRAPSLRETVFETVLSTGSHPLLAEHRINGDVVVPGAHHLAMLLAAAAAGGAGSPALRDVVFPQPLVLAEAAERAVQTVLEPDSARMRLVTYDDPAWTEYVTAQLEPDEQPQDTSLDPDAVQERCSRTVDDLDAFYKTVSGAGLDLGPGFRWLGRVWGGDGEALGAVRRPDQLDTGVPYPVHPGLLDACFQLLGLAQPLADGELPLYVPFSIERLRVAQQPGDGVWAYAQARAGGSGDPAAIVGDVRVVDRSGRVVVEMEGLRLRQVDPAAMRRRSARQDDLLYELTWQAAAATGDPAAGGEPGSWLVFADERGLGRQLVSTLETDGGSGTLVRPGAAYEQTGDGLYSVNPHRRDDFTRLLDSAPDGGWRGVVYLWPLDAAADPDAQLSSLEDAQRTALQGALHLVQALATKGISPRLYLATRGAVAVGELTGPLALGQAPVWGLASVVALEHPDLRCTRIDLDPAAATDDAAPLAAELRAGGHEDRVALRGGGRYVARLSRYAAAGAGQPLAVPSVESYRLDVATPGVLDQLVLRPAARQEPTAGQVELRVTATGLNFRDVLNALGLYPGDAGPLGLECAGEVVAVGPAVPGLSVGDRVVALAPASFGRFVTVDSRLVAPLPAEIGDAEAATVPVTFLTALHTLERIGRLKAGDRVLVHAAAGGVGMAAVQVAQAAGAEVLATASPAKWPVLEQMGVRHVFSSRTLAFAEEIRDRTGGEGVDVVVNSLTGDFITESLKLLRPGGRFIEIGKRETWPAERVAEVRDDVTYTAFDLVELARDEPGTVQELLRSLLRQLAGGALRPLPYRVFGLPQAVDAFRYMAQARHTGKIVVAHDPAAAGTAADAWDVVRPDGTYLVTGGLGGLGLRVARWLVERGARSLVLVGRSGVSDASRADVAALRDAGAQVTVAQADVAQADAVARLVAEVTATLPPLRGVVHAAGVLDDGILLQQRWPRFERVLGPKLAGAWHLHRATGQADLDFFVLFSSVASVLGSAGQGNYAAGNAFLDLLAAERRRLGLPGLSINWGPWRGAGMAASVDHGDRQWTARGVGLVEPDQGVALLEQALAQPVAQLAIFAVDWPAYLRQYPAGQQPPLLADLAGPAQVAAGGPAAGGTDHRALLRRLETAAPGDRPDVVLAHVRDLAARVLGLKDAHTLDTQQPLNELGLDSLMAVELRNALSLSVDRSLPATLLFDYPTVESLAAFVGQELQPAQEAQPQAPVAPAVEQERRDAWVAEIGQLSDAEVEALLEKELSMPREKGRHE
ncbi:MAG TPA: SDR family NAD(P)-dependent oxidoreductase, partial [Micromonosporaceae bacterium]|nr:SDR family NAD(P)-dependent oxidoreductase [Micromonosporaceae bacterium]